MPVMSLSPKPPHADPPPGGPDGKLATAVLETPAPAGSTGPSAGSGHSRSGLAIAIVIALLGAALASVVVLRNSSHGHASTQAQPSQVRTPQTSAPAASSPKASAPPTGDQEGRTQLITWSIQNLARNSVIVADRATATRLQSAGFGNAHNDSDGTDLSSDKVNYLMSVPGSDNSSPIRSQCARGAIQVAAFGASATPTTVALVSADDQAQIAALQSANAAGRKQAGRQLSANPNFTSNLGPEGQLISGRLDLRAETVLALLTQQTRVTLTSTTADPAEAKAGLPVRTITIHVSDPSQVTATLDELPATYKPTGVDQSADGTFDLQWPVAAATLQPGQ